MNFNEVLSVMTLYRQTFPARTFLCALIASLLVWIPVLPAAITNEGDDAVNLEIHKKDRTVSFVKIYPGQTVDLPYDSASVRVASLSAGEGWGDENIVVKVIESSGKEGIISRLGGNYLLGQEEEEEAPQPLTDGLITNEGNVPVDILVIRSTQTQRQRVYVGQPITLPKDTVEVQTVQNRFLRGDEIINLKVNLPTGKTGSIKRLGAAVDIQEE